MRRASDAVWVYVLETEAESRGSAKVVLGVPCCRLRSHGESRQQVFRLKGTNGEVPKQIVIHAAARGHGKRILCVECAKGEPVVVCHTEEHLSESRELAEMPVKHPPPTPTFTLP